MVWIDHVLRVARAPMPMRLLNAGWFLAIMYSTVAVKQHVVLDVIAGALLGLAFGLASLRWQRRAVQDRGELQRPQ